MTAHTTPRMIIIYKKKVIRKKKRKSGFHMKDINPSIFLLLLIDSFLILLTLVKTQCNRLVEAPNLVLVLKPADHQQWTKPLAKAKDAVTNLNHSQQQRKTHFPKENSSSGWVHTWPWNTLYQSHQSPFPHIPEGREEAAGDAGSPAAACAALCDLLLREGAHASQNSLQNNFQQGFQHVLLETARCKAGGAEAAVHSPHQHWAPPETLWKLTSPPGMLQSRCHY